MTKIKPCPFCGTVPLVGYSGETYRCDNKECILYQYIFPAWKWNDRPKKNKKNKGNGYKERAFANELYIKEIMKELRIALQEISVFQDTNSAVAIIRKILWQYNEPMD